MASIALRNIRCIDYLAYGTIFTRAMFLPKKKLKFFLDFFFRQKSPRCSPGGGAPESGGGANLSSVPGLRATSQNILWSTTKVNEACSRPPHVA